jgi:hypothetical protein
MFRKTLALAALGLVSFSDPVMAVPTPYGNPGTINPVTYTFTATGNGPITAYFVGQTAGYGSDIGLSINGAAPLIYGLQNHAVSSIYGASFVMGNVNAGDTLTFILRVSTGNANGPTGPGDLSYTLSSDSSQNPNGEHHIYSYAYGGDLTIPAGTYIGFEDISPLNAPGNDRDYDDHQFVFTGVRGVPSVPEGGLTITMLGMAVTGLGLLRRKL